MLVSIKIEFHTLTGFRCCLILDKITASYTLEEQHKLVEVQLSDYATKKVLADEALAIHEAMIPLTRELHSHENMAVLDMLTAEKLALLSDLQQFEDSTNDIQTIRESVEPIIWHHNLTLLNSLTSAKIAKWDKISDVETELQQFQDSTQHDQQIQNGTAIKIPFQWLSSDSHVTTLSDCNISNGTHIILPLPDVPITCIRW